MAGRIEAKGARLRNSLRLAWLLALAAVFLAPAIRTGYWSEDLYQSIVPRGDSVLKGTSLLGAIAEHVKVTMTIGRFFPLTPALMSTVHFVFREAWTYKAFIVATGVLDILAFYLLASKLSGRRDYGGFAACLTIGLIQYRAAVDPCLGFSGQMQLLIAALFFSLLALEKHLETRKGVWLLVSGLLYFACTLLYETSYLLIVLPWILILKAPDSWTRRAWTALPFFAAAGFCALETFLVRWLFPSGAYWHKPSFDAGAVALAVAHQASAGLPLTYFAFDPLKLFPDRGGLLGWLVDARLALVAVAAFGLSFACLRKRDRDVIEPGGVAWLLPVGLGLILALVPTIVTAISPYHRARLSPGVGWIAVLIQYYGVGLLLSTALWNAVHARAWGGSRALGKSLATAAVVGLLVGVTYRANLDVVRCFNAPVGSPWYRDSIALSGGARDNERRLLEAALGSGLMDDVPGGAVVQCSNIYPFWYDAGFGRYFYAAHAGKAFTTLPPGFGTGLDGFRVRDVALGSDSGYVVLSKGLRGPLDPVDQPATGGLRLFVRHPALARPEAGAPFWIARGEGPPTIAGRELRALKSGRGWALYSLENPGQPLSPESLRVVFSPPGSSFVAPAVAEEPSRASR